ncbi:hypothetical protein PMAC_000582 [Pneumocystis sp. 'macacae']|nr:hypothetical protein PMAC_000582 [Pneumocystis sp. 'macacae']
MNKRYDLNICGEGGEYESLVLDCPIFQKRIKILRSQVVDHSSGDVAYLNFTAELEEKSFVDTKWKKEFILPQELNKKYKQLKKYIDNGYSNQEYKQSYIIPTISIKSNISDKLFTTFSSLKNLIAIGEINTHNLKNYNLELSSIIFVELIFKKKEHVFLIDVLYNQYFNFPKPPSRICINCNNLEFNRIQISVLADSSHKKRSVIHLHSRNYWIPANIGSYSHALMYENIVLTSGQIGIIPSTMCLPYPKSFSSEIVISLQNLERIFENMKISSMSCIAFISNECYVLPTNEIWKHSFLYNNDCLIILVNTLFSEALIEWNIIAKRECEISCNGITESNLWSISFSTFKIYKDSELSLENQINDFLAQYLPCSKSKQMHTKKPFLTLTYAQSINNKIGVRTGSAFVLSCKESKALTHKLRIEHDAILIGVGTAENDNPRLNARILGSQTSYCSLELQPIPVILDPSFRLKLTHKSKIIYMAKNKWGHPPIVLVAESFNCQEYHMPSFNILNAIGGKIIRVKTNVNGLFEWNDILCTLLKLKITSVMVEGGANVISTLLKEWKLIDSIIITISPIFIEDHNGVGIKSANTLCQIKNISWKTFGKDIVLAGKLSL